MLRSRRLSYLVGAATLWLPLYFLGFIVFSVAFVMTQSGSISEGGPPPAFLVLLALHLLTVGLGFALMAVYLVDVFRNPDLLDRQDFRIMWVVLVIVLGAFAMAVYWWLYLRPGSESFSRRSELA